MTNDFEKVFDTAAEPQDYTGEDGLLYCGSCRTPKEAYFPADKAALFGRDRHPAECDCQRAKRLEREAAEQRRKHLDTVEDLKRRGFTDSKMREWTFANDNGKCPQMGMAHSYVERWEQIVTAGAYPYAICARPYTAEYRTDFVLFAAGGSSQRLLF